MLDLRSGYQVWMDKAVIEKTTSRIHYDHFDAIRSHQRISNILGADERCAARLHSQFCAVFFDDILIYSASWSSHLQHVRAVLHSLRGNHLTVKKSKCSFGTTKVAYLGHLISGQGVDMDAEVEAVQALQQLHTVRAVCGFLDLTGYYRKFIRSYGEIAEPLSPLLKREAFCWTWTTF
jgi:hypothetical protein